ncbi:hypothetical protein ACTJIL_05285 [Luteimonas sp. 22616]|uniref:hypothetical protein n=1 Tax=Luteimonas sp. 22616 TaxID=3453951 RepID=UPI003F83A323
MTSYPAIHQIHVASAVVTILLAVAVPVMGWQWRRRGTTPSRWLLILDHATSLAMLATMLTGVIVAGLGGWWPLAWIHTSTFVLGLTLAVDTAALLVWKRLPGRLRWNCRPAALLIVLALMVAKPT